MKSEYQELFRFSITIWEVLGNILVATVCGSLVSLFYALTHRQITYSVSFAKSMVMLSMITSFVMMVIGDNLARAFGMVGLISLIQFRTTMKGARDFMFIFFALAIGLAAGVGLYAVSVVGTFCIGLIIWAVTEFKPSARAQQVFVLQFTRQVEENQDQELETLLHTSCLKYKQQASKSGFSDTGVFTRYSYHVMFKPGQSNYDLIRHLHQLQAKEISLQSIKNG
ncbi:MAG: DUF4956 domain-containing protein [Adhaeribacter sp.]